MDKKELVQQVIANLADQTRISARSSMVARQASIDAPGAMQSHSDTTKAQQGWLSDSLAQMGAKTRMQAQDILRVDLSFSEQIRLGSVVTVRNEKTGIRTTYFILPGASGMTVQTENEKVTVISPNTPIAKGILMKRSGERCAVPTPSGTQFIVIESIS